ncbi:MAG: hypothetical protein KatS3mg114_1052 [Planctomycetaceae bacterium]|nr:MAG: hypothetical protein KatS3mg114_1052 [Planctomycetaceae bacterium]
MKHWGWFLLFVPPLWAGETEWPSFRNGGTSQTTTKLPRHWSPQENIAWQREMPGYGQSSPVLWHGTLYVTQVEGAQKESGLLLAYDLECGDLRWVVEVPCTLKAPSNYWVSRAAPTPVVDAQAVYVFFEGGELLAVSHEGKQLWHRALVTEFGPFDNHHGLGSSLEQTADALFLNIQHKGPSYLLCVDKITGRTRWKVDRPSSMAWSSPVIWRPHGEEYVVISAGGSVTAYEPTTGQRAWELKPVNGNNIPSPTPYGDHLFVAAALSDFDVASEAAQSNLCLRLNSAREPEVCWRATRALCDYASPVIGGAFVYYINRAGVLYCLDRHHGQEYFAQRLPAPCWATPIVCGEHVYLFGKNGVTTVFAQGKTWQEVAVNWLWDPDHPPKPEQYVETPRGPAHDEGGEGGGRRRLAGPPASNAEAQQGFAATLFQHDANQDGVLSPEELPAEQQRLIARGDQNGDGQLDRQEVQKMAEEFRSRRQSVREESRDPIVYAAAAAHETLVLRTGTRLYVIRELGDATARSAAPQ